MRSSHGAAACCRRPILAASPGQQGCIGLLSLCRRTSRPSGAGRGPPTRACAACLRASRARQAVCTTCAACLPRAQQQPVTLCMQGLQVPANAQCVASSSAVGLGGAASSEFEPSASKTPATWAPGGPTAAPHAHEGHARGPPARGRLQPHGRRLPGGQRRARARPAPPRLDRGRCGVGRRARAARGRAAGVPLDGARRCNHLSRRHKAGSEA